MPRFGLPVIIAAGLALGGIASADEVPLPIKKPRDATGAAAVPGRTPFRPGVSTRAKTSASDTSNRKSIEGATVPSAVKKPATKDAAKGAIDKQPPRTSPGKTIEKRRKSYQDKPAKAETKKEPDDPKTEEVKKTPKVLTEWPEDEIARAKANCEIRLKGLNAVAVPEAPFRKNECGAAAPVRLMSVGAKPQVVLDPPAIVTCDMVAGMEEWVQKDLQRLAKKHLGTKIAKIKVMSDYACRNAYGRTTTKLSEHGRANALDIRGFVTADAKKAYLLQGWGPAKRDITAAKKAIEETARKKAEAIKAAAEKAAAERAAAEKAAPPGDGREGKGSKSEDKRVPIETSAAQRRLRTDTIADGIPKTGRTASGVNGDDAGADLNPPRQLGGPGEKARKKKTSKTRKKATKNRNKKKAQRKTAAISPEAVLNYKPTPVSRFLHGAHAAACKIFGTTLGPEANNAHRNHFHVDMAPRKRRKYCE